MKIKIGIIDYGICNLNSVVQSFEVLEYKNDVINNKFKVSDYTHLVLPGVGSFPKGMENILKFNLSETIKNWIKSGKPILGICLGMQLFAKVGFEFQKTNGFGVINDNIKKIKTKNLKTILPHIGWNNVKIIKESRLLNDIDYDNSFYFVHSYAYSNSKKDHVVGITDYDCDIVSVIEKDNVLGVQFHPEKSQKYGLKLINNFVTKNKC